MQHAFAFLEANGFIVDVEIVSDKQYILETGIFSGRKIRESI
jgi:hypothetical protein